MKMEAAIDAGSTEAVSLGCFVRNRLNSTVISSAAASEAEQNETGG